MTSGNKTIVRMTVNGEQREDLIPGNMLLLDYLREVLQLTGSKSGCDGGECGACTVLVDGEPHLACIDLAVRVDGKRWRPSNPWLRTAACPACRKCFMRNWAPSAAFVRRA